MNVRFAGVSIAAVSVILAGGPLGPFPARADGRPSNRQQAVDLFRQSEAEYRRGNFAEAVRLIERAHDLEPAPVLLYNLARAYERLGDRPGAARSYSRYLASEPNAPDRQAIERRIRRLHQQIAETRDGAAQRERRARARSLLPAGHPRERAAGAGGAFPWIVTAAGLAATVTGVAVGVLAYDQHQEAAGDPIHRSAVQKEERAERLAVASTITLVSGAALAATGILWLLTRGSPNPEPRTERLRVGAAPGLIVVEGRLP